MPDAPTFSQLSPLPVSANLVFMNTLDLWEGGLGVGWLVVISLLDTLPLCMNSCTRQVGHHHIELNVSYLVGSIIGLIVYKGGLLCVGKI